MPFNTIDLAFQNLTGDDSASFKERCRNARPTASQVGLSISNLRASSHHYSRTEICGPASLVASYVRGRVESDSYTEWYEHTALRVVKVEELPDNKVRVELFKNHYAGD